MIPRLTREG